MFLRKYNNILELDGHSEKLRYVIIIQYNKAVVKETFTAFVQNDFHVEYKKVYFPYSVLKFKGNSGLPQPCPGWLSPCKFILSLVIM